MPQSLTSTHPIVGFTAATPNAAYLGPLYALLAGLAIFLGAALAHTGLLQKRCDHEALTHSLTAMGAGALLSAIAFVLVPEGIQHQSPLSVMLSFACGGVVFMLTDTALARSGSKLAQFLAMLLDFIPETIALGVLVARGELNQAAFVAAIISVQNFPEGYSAFEEMSAPLPSPPDPARKKLLWRFLAISLSGPIYFFLGSRVFVHQEELVSVGMTFCAGGILYLLFQDIAPKVPVANHHLPPLAALLGFCVGLAGYLWT